MPTREEVYRAINAERDYQDNLPETRRDGRDHTVGEYIVMLHYYMNNLDKCWSMYPGDSEALEVMRKIAGIAVHCMEDHGAPYRSAIPPSKSKITWGHDENL